MDWVGGLGSVAGHAAGLVGQAGTLKIGSPSLSLSGVGLEPRMPVGGAGTEEKDLDEEGLGRRVRDARSTLAV